MSAKNTFVLDDSELLDEPFSDVCSRCVHLVDRHRCTAFGERDIPEAIWNGRNPHTKPFPGDNGVRFELAQAE